jgi:predicted alpha/beta-fold hydrolase
VSYRAPWWLPGRHLQTVYPALVLRPRPPRYRREQWNTPDGDRIDVDRIDGPDDAPFVVLFHGLEGNSGSPYAAALMSKVASLGWRGAVPHFRGCGGTPNLAPRAYHSGDAEEIGWILERFRAIAGRALFAAGISLGGNALLKWLAREGQAANPLVAAAAAVSAPLDLMAAGTVLGRGFNRVYTAEFLRTLRPKALAQIDRFPGLADRTRVAGARDFHEFDDAFTAPLHGYRDVADYWTRASSLSDLPRIRVPTLVLNARNDPFLPAHRLPDATAISPSVTLEQPRSGGHVGFVSGPFPGNVHWLPTRLCRFFTESGRSDPP